MHFHKGQAREAPHLPSLRDAALVTAVLLLLGLHHWKGSLSSLVSLQHAEEVQGGTAREKEPIRGNANQVLGVVPAWQGEGA